MDAVLAGGLRLFPLDVEHGLTVARLPLIHCDPFDRLLIAQAMAEELVVIASDRRVLECAVTTVAA